MFKIDERRFCPKCESENIELQQSNLYGAPGTWVCRGCGFHNVEFPIKEKEEENKNG